MFLIETVCHLSSWEAVERYQTKTNRGAPEVCFGQELFRNSGSGSGTSPQTLPLPSSYRPAAAHAVSPLSAPLNLHAPIDDPTVPINLQSSSPA